MKRFKNILFFADGSEQPNSTLLRAAKLAETNQARLTLIDVIEPVDTPSQIRSRFNVNLTDLFKQQRIQFLDDMSAHIHQQDQIIYNRVLEGIPFIEIIKMINQGGYDLLIKQARTVSGIGERLFGSHDLHLLRKCPCPVLIDRPDSGESYKKVLAAVDTDSTVSESCDRLVMDLATSLASGEQADLDIVHAWRFEGESMYRSGRLRLPGNEFENMLIQEAQNQQSKLDKLLQHYNMSSSDDHVHLIKGRPADTIDQIAKLKNADIIVMGTVGRAGVPGLFIGNTAEQILQTTSASVLAVKPNGFVSPVH